jgi:hypothetical protein
MSQGVSNVQVLYDKDGNPVNVVLEDGQYRVMTTDRRTQDILDNINMTLLELISVIRGMKP